MCIMHIASPRYVSGGREIYKENHKKGGGNCNKVGDTEEKDFVGEEWGMVINMRLEEGRKI